MMNKDTDKITQSRLPAEWEGDNAVIISWPHAGSDWAYMLPQATECYIGLAHAITRHAVLVVVAPDTAPIRHLLADIPEGRVIYFDTPTNDTWIRDYGVITTISPDGKLILNDFGFNAWGGKFESALDNGVTSRMVAAGLLRGVYADRNGFILEGGSIESDGQGTILTTASCLLTPTRNPQYTKAQVEQVLKDTLGATNILWLNSGAMLGDDTDGHIDTIARFAPHRTILYNGQGWGNSSPDQSEALGGILDELREMRDAHGQPYNIVELPIPDEIRDPDDGHPLPATYANFLIINDAVIMPTYGQPANDLRAEMAIRVAFPSHTIERVDCRALIRQNGSLHCATMQVPQKALPI